MWTPPSLPLGPLARPVRGIRRHLPEWNFITIHYTYFLATCLLFATLFWGSSTPARSVSYTDSLFLVVSAMTLAGLNTVNLSELNTFQQVQLFVLIMLGSAIWVSMFVVWVRRRAFRRKFEVVIMEQRARKNKAKALRRGRTWSRGSKSKNEAFDQQRETEDGKLGGNSEDSTAVESDMLDGAVDGDTKRDVTPPARRGGPEMNRTSGEQMDGMSEVKVSAVEGRQGITWRGDTRAGPPTLRTYDLPPARPARQHRPLFDFTGIGARPLANLNTVQRMPTLTRFDSGLAPKPKSKGDISQYLHDATGWISRNSQFNGLTEDERERLGGCEYRAISFLAWLVPAYFVAWQVLTCIALGAYVHNNRRDTVESNGLNAYWVGAFNAVSAFNNSGMSLLDANMTAFQTSYYMLLTMSLLILAGNTCYPIFLRMIIRGMLTLISSPIRFPGAHWDERRKTLNFLLDHPRRCYTNLFPSRHTWWLAGSVFLLNAVDWALFELLNIGNTALTAGLALRYRVIDGLFQAFAVRSGGFYVVAIPKLRAALQVVYVVMMYISVYPVVITMRNSNVYEERSLGLYSEDLPDDDDDEENPRPATPTSSLDSASGLPAHATAPKNPSGFLLRRAKTLATSLTALRASNPNSTTPQTETNTHFVRHQLRAQLAHDAWWIVLALFLTTVLESRKIAADPLVYSTFNFLFEIVSAYGCVGISVGVPTAAFSFCGSWGPVSKLVLVAVMLRGRHRGLPVAIDKAVLLPGEALGAAEEEDALVRGLRRRTTLGFGGAGPDLGGVGVRGSEGRGWEGRLEV